MNLVKTAILLIWLGAVIDPVGQLFYIRYFGIGISLGAIIFLISTGKIQIIEKSYRAVLILFISVILPTYGLLIYSIHFGVGDFIDTSYIAAGLLMAFSLLYVSSSLSLFGLKVFLFSARVLSALIIFVYGLLIFGREEWVGFFTMRSIALVGSRDYATISFPYIYFLASPMLIFLMAYDFSRLSTYFNVEKLILFAVSSLALFLSGTRAHIIIAITFTPIYLLLTSRNGMVLKIALLTVVFLMVGLTFDGSKQIINSFFSSNEINNSMKIALLDGYWEILSQPENLIFGQGFNAHEWSPQLRGMIAMEDNASKTELTYLELIRVFGLFVASAFIVSLGLFVRATKSLPKEFNWIYPGLVIYLFNAGINPYLFSVNGILPLGLFSAIQLYFRGANQKH